MDLSQYLETMKKLPERFSNLNFWRGVRKLRDKMVDTFEYVGMWGNGIEGQIDSLKNDLANYCPINLEYQKLNLLAMGKYLDGDILIDKNLVGYSETTFLPIITNGNDIVVTMSTAKMETKGITGFKWDKGTSTQAFVGYTENVRAFNGTQPPTTYDRPSAYNENICISLPKDSPYIYVKADLDNVETTKDIRRWIDASDLKTNASVSIVNDANEKLLSSTFLSGTYEPDVDGSVLVRFSKTENDFDAFITLSDNYDYELIRFWEDDVSWELLKSYKYTRGGTKIIVPSKCSMIQINAYTNIVSGKPITINIEKLLLEPRIKALENIAYPQNIIASVNMFNSIGAIGDSFTQGTAKNSSGEWYQATNQSWIGTLAKRSCVDFANYGLGGATTRSYIVDKLNDVLNDNPKDLYFFALGQNDGNQHIAIGSENDIHDDNYTLNADTFYGNYGKIVAMTKAHSPKAKLIFIKNWVRGATWTDYDVAIERIASHYNAPCINPFDDYFFGSSIYLDYFNDNHPTAMGYSMIGLAVERLFSRCVVDNPDYFKYSTIG